MTRTAVPVFSSVLFAVALFTPAVIQAQGPAGSSARDIQTEVQKNEPRVDQIIERANDHFRKAKLNLEDNKREQARDEFDKAVDAILMSGMDVRSSQRLQTYYLELVERIYREEVPLTQIAPNATPVVAQAPADAKAESEIAQAQPKQQQIGFVQQGFEPSPLDALSKLILTEDEKTVTAEQLATLEQVKNSLDFKFTMNPLVQQYINFYQGRGGRNTMESGLRRSGRYMKIARDAFRKAGVPEDIVWLGQVESAWQPRAKSWAAASGLWQFIGSTGAAYGLRQTAWVDERNGIEKPTSASARHLKDLANRYNGDWLLAMAAYEHGRRQRRSRDSRAGEANFWKIYP